MPPGRKRLDPAVKAERRRASLHRYAEKSARIVKLYVWLQGCACGACAQLLPNHPSYRLRHIVAHASLPLNIGRSNRIELQSVEQTNFGARRNILTTRAWMHSMRRPFANPGPERRRNARALEGEARRSDRIWTTKTNTEDVFRPHCCQSQSQFRLHKHFDPPRRERCPHCCPYCPPHANVPCPMQYDGMPVKIWRDPGPGVQRLFFRNGRSSPHDSPDVVLHPAVLPHQKTYPSYTLPSGVKPLPSASLLLCAPLPFAQALPRICRRRLNADPRLPRRPQNTSSLKKRPPQRRAASSRRGQCLSVPAGRRGVLNVHVSAQLQSLIIPPTTSNE
ncbi:hypothetical protein C8F04DRAFT_1253348 [Mycena alexandri]|uniref:Uncharacterized protein n=1 Tax=Mycena alexandri TaxID=1745969 RepID=A0AAD6XAG4_9AGAR|nr:hypothetical protein C8F04DRAFT_1253348 [Mycena alexandri]